MVTSLGYALAKNSLVTGFGRRHYHHVHRVGGGVGRRVAGAVVSRVGHSLVDKLAHAISGTGRRRRVHRGASYRLTGTGTHRRKHVRKPRATLMHLLAPSMGGYRRRRAPRRTLGLGRRRRRIAF